MSMRESLAESLRWMGGVLQVFRGVVGTPNLKTRHGVPKRSVEWSRRGVSREMLAKLERKKNLAILATRTSQIR